MVQFRVHAQWLPNTNGFKVEFSTSDDRHIEIMDEARYFNFCDKLDTELQISGWKIVFENGKDNEVEDKIRDYFRAVRESYEEAKERGEI
jgi:hypothetical protein